jgi:hypothetical protein
MKHTLALVLLKLSALFEASALVVISCAGLSILGCPIEISLIISIISAIFLVSLDPREESAKKILKFPIGYYLRRQPQRRNKV